VHPNVSNFAQTHLPFWLCIARRRVISMTMTVQEYRANARQCLSWAESASDPENREAFFALAATWESVAERIERSNATPDRTADEPSPIQCARLSDQVGGRWRASNASRNDGPPLPAALVGR
jgi:hypothetical protein